MPRRSPPRRRTFLRTVVGTGLVSSLPVLSGCGGRRDGSETATTTKQLPGRAEPTVDVQPGESLAMIFENIADGDSTVLPAGKYRLDRDVNVHADDFTFDGNGSTVLVPEPVTVTVTGSGWEFGFVNWKPKTGENENTWLRMRPDGDRWHLHHLAWTSKNRTPIGNRMKAILPGVKKGGYAEITDCWFGNRCQMDAGKASIACWGRMDGELWIRRSYFYQQGVYGTNNDSRPIYTEGVTNFDSCYFENCYLHGPRTGSHFSTATVKDCVINQTDKSEIPWTRGKTRETGRWASRGIYVYNGPVNVVNTDIDATADQLDRAIHVLSRGVRQTPIARVSGGNIKGDVLGNVTIEGYVGDEPSHSPPASCVTSPEDAYSRRR